MSSDLLKDVVRATLPRELRNWLRSPSRSAEWVWDSTRFSFGVTKTIELPRGMRFVCHPYAFKVYRQAQIDDPEQRDEFQNFVSNCSKAMLLFDIGAHFGVFSLAAASLGGTAVAIDPSPTATHMIARQAALNGATDRIRIVEAAVSDSSGVARMLSSGVFTDGYFRFASGRLKSDLRSTCAVTIDELTREFGVPTHIKIDVEGHEASALRGATSTLDDYSPILFLELHNEMVAADGGDPNAALSELARLDYRTFALSGEEISNGIILGSPIVRIVAKRR